MDGRKIFRYLLLLRTADSGIYRLDNEKYTQSVQTSKYHEQSHQGQHRFVLIHPFFELFINKIFKDTIAKYFFFVFSRNV